MERLLFNFIQSGELLNFLLLGVQFTLTDKFLNNKFQWYGMEVVYYYSIPYRDRMNPSMAVRNPMCSVFPSVTSCSIPNVGAAGGEQVTESRPISFLYFFISAEQIHNGLCVLTQNIINEKIYLVLWFWYAFLAPFSICFIAYRIITIFFSGVRFALLYRTVSLLLIN